MVINSPAPKSIKEARKLLGKQYQCLADSQIEEIVMLLNIVAVDFVQQTVPKS